MISDKTVNFAINIRSAVTTQEIVEWLHKMTDTIVGVPHIGKLVCLRSDRQGKNVEESQRFKQISPQIAC